MEIVARVPENCFQQSEFGAVPDTCKQLQVLPRFGGQTGQLANHEFHHIVGITLRVDAIEVPRPARRIMIEGKHRRLKLQRHICRCHYIFM